jgi:rsbT co-antagonist protein RsbR
VTESDALEDLLASTPSLLFVTDEGGRLARWSEALARRVCPDLALAKGTPLADLVHPDDRGTLAEAWTRLDGAPDPVQVDVRLQGAGPTSPRLSLEMRRRPAAGAVHGVVQEIGPADLASLRRQEQLLRAILDNINVVVWALDRNGTFTFHDGKGLEAGGLKRGQFLGMNVFEIYPSDSANADEVRLGFEGNTYHSYGYHHGVYWENWVIPTRRGEEVVGLLGMTLDITERKLAEQELQAKIHLIERQQEVIRTLSTPIIEVWEGVLVMPMVGILDSKRAADVMQDLLDRVTASGAGHVILDLTGVEMVDTQVASHLLSLVAAVGLLGAEGVITGIRPSVAQTMVSLGLDLHRVVTHANLRAGLGHCIAAIRRRR